MGQLFRKYNKFIANYEETRATTNSENAPRARLYW